MRESRWPAAARLAQWAAVTDGFDNSGCAAERPADRIRGVEARSAGFRRELGLLDLVLVQILYVVGSGWVGTAAKLGTDHIAFWLAAAALYYLPQAAVVIFLNRRIPLEGGLYQWATVGLRSVAGFLVAWNLWAYAVLVLATFGVMIATNLCRRGSRGCTRGSARRRTRSLSSAR